MGGDRRTPWLLLLPFLAWTATFLILPLGSVAVMSFHSRTEDYEIRPDWTAVNYARAADPGLRPVLVRSVQYAATTTLLCLVLGYPVAYFMAVHGGARKGILLFLLMLPFWTSYLIRTYAWMTLLQTEGALNALLLGLSLVHEPLAILNTPTAVVLGLTYAFLPFATLPMYVSLERLDPALVEASADLGASPAASFLRVVLPLSMPGVVAGTLLVFVPAMGDFVTPELLGGPDTTMIGNVIQQQFLGAFDWPFGSALALVVMVLLLAATALYLRVAGPERV